MNSNTYLRTGARTLVALGVLFAATVSLESTPPLWWDEGWVLEVARNWIERGHYGHLLAGEPTATRISTGFPVVAPVALSFRLFGIGIGQARLVGVLFTVGALALLYYLALSLYNRSVATATVAVSLLIARNPDIHPLLIGRQAIGEMPALFYLLAGYVCFILALSRSSSFMPLTVSFWAIALITKLQILPFWTVALLTSILWTLLSKSWRLSALLTIGFFGSLITSALFRTLVRSLVSYEALPLSLISLLYDTSVWVPLLSTRVGTLLSTLVLGLPTLLGLGYALLKFVRDRQRIIKNDHLEIVRVSLLFLAGSWLSWYLFLSVGWPRYLFPATFIGSIFVAVMLYDLTQHFNVSYTVKCLADALRNFVSSRRRPGTLLLASLFVITSLFTLRMLYRAYFVNADNSVLAAVQFLNAYTPTSSLIETYESELFFLLNRHYHYPPDEVHIELNRRTFQGRDVAINYDPLAADPDYLVVGHQSELWQLYDPVLETGAFRLLRTYGRYEIYERVR